MIPLYFFLIAWLAFLGFYAIMGLLSVLQITRFGVAGHGTWYSTMIFLVVFFLVIAGTGMYLVGIDWTQPFNVMSIFGLSSGPSI